MSLAASYALSTCSNEMDSKSRLLKSATPSRSTHIKVLPVLYNKVHVLSCGVQTVVGILITRLLN